MEGKGACRGRGIPPLSFRPHASSTFPPITSPEEVRCGDPPSLPSRAKSDMRVWIDRHQIVNVMAREKKECHML